ncbi:MAG: CBS domain-containing protein [Acidilobaceae archaeon]
MSVRAEASPIAITSEISRLLKRPPVYVHQSVSVRDAVLTMYRENVGSILVVDERGMLVGIFTERDLVRIVALGVSLETPISEVMTVNPVSVKANARIVDVVEIMVEKRIRHVPVVDEMGRPVGVVSVRDIVDVM